MFDLGQRIFWIEDERTTTRAAKVRVCDALYLSARYNGDAVAVVLPNGVVKVLPNRPTLFTDPNDANCYAFGVAVRLIRNFQYDTCEVTDNAGRFHDFTASVPLRGYPNGAPKQA